MLLEGAISRTKVATAHPCLEDFRILAPSSCLSQCHPWVAGRGNRLQRPTARSCSLPRTCGVDFPVGAFRLKRPPSVGPQFQQFPGKIRPYHRRRGSYRAPTPAQASGHAFGNGSDLTTWRNRFISRLSQGCFVYSLDIAFSCATAQTEPQQSSKSASFPQFGGAVPGFHPATRSPQNFGRFRVILSFGAGYSGSVPPPVMDLRMTAVHWAWRF